MRNPVWLCHAGILNKHLLVILQPQYIHKFYFHSVKGASFWVHCVLYLRALRAEFYSMELIKLLNGIPNLNISSSFIYNSHQIFCAFSVF